MISYTVDVFDTSWHTIGLRFASMEEANAYMENLQRRYKSVRKTRIAISEDPVNYRWDGIRGDAVAMDDGMPWKGWS